MEEVATLLDENITHPAEPVKKKGGQQSLVEKFPEIVDVISEFIKQHGFSAQCYRRTDTANSLGVFASQIRNHLYQLIPGLKDHTNSLSTRRRLFQVPNKHFEASERYKNLINVRVGIKSNAY